MNKKVILIISSLVLLFFLPQLFLISKTRDATYSKVDGVPTAQYGIVFGARVYDNGEISPVALERVLAGALLYKEGKVSKLFISGTNSANKEVETLAARAVAEGVKKEDIVMDYLGIDTEDTCRHFKKIGSEAVLITQSFHLPRAMHLCQKHGIAPRGLAANRLELLADRGGSWPVVYWTKAKRFTRESALTWLYLTGSYSVLSSEAEELERVDEEAGKPKFDPQSVLLTVIKLTPGAFRPVMEYSRQPKRLADWINRNEEEIVINGAYFHQDYSPSGYLVTEGKRVGTRMFDQDKSGLVIITDDTLSIRDLAKNPLQKSERFDYALQSFPFLIKDGQPAITADSGKTARRTALGVDQTGAVYIIIAHQPQTLFAFMNELLTMKHYPFSAVLNLDGGPSTGISQNWQGQKLLIDNYVRVPSVVRFRKKQKLPAI